MIKLIQGDCLEELKKLDDNSVASVVTDPPYGLSFMGKKWDYDVPSVELWKEALRVLKPGGHLLSFAGSRTYHRMAVNIEDAGFEIRDQIMWVYGSGFPKSHNIGKAVDKKLGNERETLGIAKGAGNNNTVSMNSGVGKSSELKQEYENTKGTSPYEGWGTALKPAHEPIVVARKPLSEKTIAANVLKWGTGGINIDGCRVEYKSKDDMEIRKNTHREVNKLGDGNFGGGKYSQPREQGRFPANFIHDGSDEVVELFPDSKSGGSAGMRQRKAVNTWGGVPQNYPKATSLPASQGSASRFFYCAKASKAERNDGCEELEEKASASSEFRPNHTEKAKNGETGNPYGRWKPLSNNHPTVKPIKLMQYLIRLVTPENGIALDPFMGSGTTGIAAKKEGFSFTGIEMEEEYCKIAQARINL